MPRSWRGPPPAALDRAACAMRHRAPRTPSGCSPTLLGGRRAPCSTSTRAALDPDEAARYPARSRRRAAREPLQHILGWRGLPRARAAASTADVLVPRPETEALAEWALALLPAQAAAGRWRSTSAPARAASPARSRSRVADARVLAVELSRRAPSRSRRATSRASGSATRVDRDRGRPASRRWPTGAPRPRRGQSAVSAERRCPVAAAGGRGHEPALALDGGPDGIDRDPPARRRARRGGSGRPAGSCSRPPASAGRSGRRPDGGRGIDRIRDAPRPDRDRAVRRRDVPATSRRPSDGLRSGRGRQEDC